MSTETLLIFCTCPSPETAEKIAHTVVEQNLAACVNLTAPVTSVYKWDGRLQADQEILMLAKTTRERYGDLERVILSLHPYELPEIIAVPLDRGLTGYLNWVEQCTKTTL